MNTGTRAAANSAGRQITGRNTSLIDAPAAADRAPVRFFVSDRLAPRRRRASDFFRLIVGFGAFALLGWAASKDPQVDQRLVAAFDNVPSWIESIAWLAFSLGSVAVLAIAVVAVVRAGHGRGVVRDLVVSLALAGIIGFVATWLTGAGSPDLLPELIRPAELPPFPTLRVTVVLVTTMVLSPYVTSAVKRVLDWSTAAVVLAPILLGLASVTSWSGAIVLSTASVAAVRVLFGTPEGLPTLSHLTDALAQAGTTVRDVAYRDRQPGTVGLATATSIDGEPLDIKVYGVEAANRQRAERIWDAMWYHSAGPAPSAGRNEQAQHEALALMSASAAGIDVPRVAAAGRTTDGDVLLVTADVHGVRLSDVERTPTPDELAAMWATLSALHREAHITHGRLDATTIRLHNTGVQLTDFAQSSLLPTQQQYATDIVSMLAVQAVASGVDNTIDAAVVGVDAADLAACLPFVQDAVIAPHLRTTVRHAHIKIAKLRGAIAERLGVDAPALAPIKRVKATDLIIVAVAIIAANTLIGQIADIGLDKLGTALAAASTGWFVVAFLLKFAGFVDGAYALRALVGQPLPLLPTSMLQSAKGFVGLAVPNVAGQNGLDLRYLQKQGVPLSMAASQGPLKSVIGFVAKMVLLIWSGWTVGRSIDTSALAPTGAGASSSGLLIWIVIAVIVVGTLVIAAVPRWRAVAISALRDLIASVRQIVSSPRTVVSVFATETLAILLSALSLAAVLAAFGSEVAFPTLVFVIIGTSMLSGLTPVPAGIGVAEATMSGLLTAVGVAPDLSVTTAITYRLLTAYLPPVAGFFSFRWLTKHGYL